MEKRRTLFCKSRNSSPRRRSCQANSKPCAVLVDACTTARMPAAMDSGSAMMGPDEGYSETNVDIKRRNERCYSVFQRIRLG
jgi:hypothetical protein